MFHFSMSNRFRIFKSVIPESCLSTRCLSVNSNPVRVRFAPSPTGFIHLGGLRTAFYNYLFAKKHNGQFILRIEDTDQDRLVDGSLDNIISCLKWSQLIPDEGPFFGGNYGPYFQSERMDIYREMSNKLLQTSSVYRCFCTSKRLELLRREAVKNRETIKYDNRCRYLSQEEIRKNLSENKQFTIRLKLKNSPVTIKDIVYGPVTYDLSKVEGDPILVKSNGFPTYHFANVIDDYLMKISHVLRGVEWLGSTPKHLMLYEAFGWPAPQYAHLPLIINNDGTKLSKRHDHIHINKYINDGFYPETIINYLSNMGGGFGELDTVACERIYSIEKLTSAFNLESVNQNNCRIDLNKIYFLNHNFIKSLFYSNIERFVTDLKSSIMNQSNKENNSYSWNIEDKVYLQKVLEWSLDRINTIKDLTEPEFSYLWSQPSYTWNPETISSHETILICLTSTINRLETLENKDFDNMDLLLETLRTIHKLDVGDNTLKFGIFMKLLRLCLTDLKAGAPVAETMWLLGKSNTIRYLSNAITYVDNSYTIRNQMDNEQHLI